MKNNVPLPLNASYLSGGAAAWAELRICYDAALKATIGENYANDEECVLARAIIDCPDLFYKIADPASISRLKTTALIRKLTRGRWPIVRPLAGRSRLTTYAPCPQARNASH